MEMWTKWIWFQSLACVISCFDFSCCTIVGSTGWTIRHLNLGRDKGFYFDSKTSWPGLRPTQPRVHWKPAFSPTNETAGIWCSPLISIFCRDKEWMEVYLISSYMSSWHEQGQFVLMEIRTLFYWMFVRHNFVNFYFSLSARPTWWL